MAIIHKKMKSKANRHMFSASEDSTMTKHVIATHAPVEGHINVRPLLNVIEDIFHSAASVIPGIVQGKQDQLGALKDSPLQPDLTDMLAIFSHTINRVSCEISCKCLGDGKAHATTMGILGMLSSHSWGAKVVIALAAFAMNFGEFWLMAQLFAINPLAKSIAMLKQIDETMEQVDRKGPKFEAISYVLKAILDVTNCVVELEELPSQYLSPDMLEMLNTTTHIPNAVYWTIRSVAACALQISGIMGMGHEYIASIMESWELSSLAHKLDNISSHLRKQLSICHQQLDDNKRMEAFQTLELLFEASHQDNLKVLKALIYNKDDQLPLFDGSTKKRVSIDVLRMRTVLLYISDLHHLSDEELLILELLYQDSHLDPTKFESQYDIVWLPIVNKATPWTEMKQKRFENLQSMMPWYSLHDPWILELAAIRYMEKEWHFNAKPILVALNPQGKVVNLNAIHMMRIWGSSAYPFSRLREETLWKEETWRLELLADTIDPSIYDWMSEGKYICLYGGEDLEWIRNFTRSVHAMAKALKAPLEIIYIGKSNPGEKVQKINLAILAEKLSNIVPNLTLIWFFWVRLESMWRSKLQHSKTIENDQIMQEIMRILSFDSSDQGWAMISRGKEKMAKAKGDTFLKCLNEYDQWKNEAKEKGVLSAIEGYIQALQTSHHCNRLILPESNGRILDKVACVECGRAMEKFFMYRCCID